MLICCMKSVYTPPHIPKCGMDNGQKPGYFATILCGKNGCGLWSVSTAEQLVSSFLTSAGSNFTFIPRSQQDLTLTEANKLTCMPR